MTTADLTPSAIWKARKPECDALLWLVNRELARQGAGDLRDTLDTRDKVAWGVHYCMGPIDTACQVIDDVSLTRGGRA